MSPEIQDPTGSETTGHTLRDQLQGALDAGALDNLPDPVEGEEIEVSVRPKAQAAPTPQTTDPMVSQNTLDEMTGQQADPGLEKVGVPPPPVEGLQMTPPAEGEPSIPQLTPEDAEIARKLVGPPEPAPTTRKGKKEEERSIKAGQDKIKYREQAAGESENVRKRREVHGDPVGPGGSGIVDRMLKAPRGLMTPENRMAGEQMRQSFFEAGAADTLVRDTQEGITEREGIRTDREMRNNYADAIKAIRSQAGRYGTPALFEPIDTALDSSTKMAEWLANAQNAVASDRNAELALKQALPYIMKAAELGTDPETIKAGLRSGLTSMGAPVSDDQFDRMYTGMVEMVMGVATQTIQAENAKNQERFLRVGMMKNQQLELDNRLLIARMALDSKDVHEYQRQTDRSLRLRDDIMDQLMFAQSQLQSYMDRHDPNSPMSLAGPAKQEDINRHESSIAELVAHLNEANRKIASSEVLATQAGVRSGRNRQGPRATYTDVKIKLFDQYLREMILDDINSAKKPSAVLRFAANVLQDPMLAASEDGEAFLQGYSTRLSVMLEGRSSLASRFRADLKDVYLHGVGVLKSERDLRMAYWEELMLEGNDGP